MIGRNVLLKIYWVLQRIIAPTLRNSQYLYEDILKSYVKPRVNWLDIGCGHQILPPWRCDEEKYLVDKSQIVVGIDCDLSSLKSHKSLFLRIGGDITKLPLRNKCFHLATANMVVEHLDNPGMQFSEVSRILKPGGIFIFHTPNALNIWVIFAKLMPNIIKSNLIRLLGGRQESDIFKTFYKANSRRKIVELASKSGFQVDKIKMTVSTALFALIAPLAIIELIWIRILMMKPFKAVRPNIIAILRKHD